MRAVTKSMEYSKIRKLQENQTQNGYKLGEFTFDHKLKKVISMIPDNAIPMEEEYRRVDSIEETPKPEEPKKTVRYFTIREPIWKDPRSVGLNMKEIGS